MTNEDTDSINVVADEIDDKFAELLDEHEYTSIVAGTALALAGLALDIPPDADITEDEQAALQSLFDQVSAPLTMVIRARLKAMGADTVAAAH